MTLADAVTPEIAAELGWPKAKYAWVEHERRWTCRSWPADRVIGTERYRDLYVAGTALRLRQAWPLDGGPSSRRLARKVDVSAAIRLLTSIYLSEAEYDLLVDLPGAVLEKTRHDLGFLNGARVFVDVFHGRLDGLVLAEAEFGDARAMATWIAPSFLDEEVTDDGRYRGGSLAFEGLAPAGTEADPIRG